MLLGVPAASVTISGNEVGTRELVLNGTFEEQQQPVREWLAEFSRELTAITERLHGELERALHVGNDEIAYFVLAGMTMATEGLILQVIGAS